MIRLLRAQSRLQNHPALRELHLPGRIVKLYIASHGRARRDADRAVHLFQLPAQLAELIPERSTVHLLPGNPGVKLLHLPVRLAPVRRRIFPRFYLRRTVELVKPYQHLHLFLVRVHLRLYILSDFQVQRTIHRKQAELLPRNRHGRAFNLF